MNITPDHLALVTIGCHGRVSIGNFGDDLQSAVADMIASGHVRCSLDSDSHDTLWCYLTASGSERLFAMNFKTRLGWGQRSYEESCHLSSES